MARIDDEDRVFDVSKPHKVGPSPTSKPVIVGHRPQISDPMMKDEDLLFGGPHHDAKVTSVPVFSEGDEKPEVPDTEEAPFKTPFDDKPKEQEHELLGEHPLPGEPAKDDWESKWEPEKKEEQKYTPLQSLIGDEDEKSEPPADRDKHQETKSDGGGDSGSSEHLVGTLSLPNAKGAGPQRSSKRLLAWVVSLILILLVGGYLAVDAGAFGSGIKLPYEFFKEKETVVQPVVTPPPPAKVVEPTVPTGFSSYELKDPQLVNENAHLKFAYPAAWGEPSLTKEEGFTKRGGSNKSDGTYAFIINFSTNKDVQIVLTSGKHLPVTRAVQYYDFLDWCIGTIDKKIYKSALKYSTSGGVDSPTTTVCDQGPLEDATAYGALDGNAIVQLKTKTPDGKVTLGDLYSINTPYPALPALRIKDATSKNADDIKKVVETIEFGLSAQ